MNYASNSKQNRKRRGEHLRSNANKFSDDDEEDSRKLVCLFCNLFFFK